MPETLLTGEQMLPKSLSDSDVGSSPPPRYSTQVIGSPLRKSPSAKVLAVEELSGSNAAAGERFWIILAHAPEHPVEVLLAAGDDMTPAEDVIERDKVSELSGDRCPYSIPVGHFCHPTPVYPGRGSSALSPEFGGRGSNTRGVQRERQAGGPLSSVTGAFQEATAVSESIERLSPGLRPDRGDLAPPRSFRGGHQESGRRRQFVPSHRGKKHPKFCLKSLTVGSSRWR